MFNLSNLPEAERACLFAFFQGMLTDDQLDFWERTMPTLVREFTRVNERELREMVKASGSIPDNRIMAIKLVRQSTGWGLKEAKEWVDREFPK
jgi:hypothetical protein